MDTKVKKDGKPKIQTCGFAAYPDEVARWQKAADADHRSLSQWIRLRLLAADRREDALYTAGMGEK
jgi:hypothetical protein